MRVILGGTKSATVNDHWWPANRLKLVSRNEVAGTSTVYMTPMSAKSDGSFTVTEFSTTVIRVESSTCIEIVETLLLLSDSFLVSLNLGVRVIWQQAGNTFSVNVSVKSVDGAIF